MVWIVVMLSIYLRHWCCMVLFRRFSHFRTRFYSRSSGLLIFWIILSYQVFWYRVFLKCIESTFSNQNLTICSVMQYRVATSLWNLENLEKHQFLAKVREKVWERKQVRKKSRLFLCKLSNAFCFLVFCLFRFLSLSTSYVALIIILYLFIYLFI